ncbi:MAG: hypothetical protein DRJ09_10395 [Bacteroidetes bacterium]|nr:MAG: hypothetical protein DRJ09_10395 [Bacteroidota bacterium]
MKKILNLFDLLATNHKIYLITLTMMFLGIPFGFGQNANNRVCFSNSLTNSHYLQVYHDYMETLNPVNYYKNNKISRDDYTKFLIDTATVYSISTSPKKYIYSYSEQGYRLTTLVQVKENGEWNDAQFEERTYDDAGNMLTSIWKYWSNNDWVYSSRTTNTYSSENYLLSSLSEIWDDDVWKYNEMDTYQYNTGGKVVTHTTQIWSNGDWANMSKDIYTYDEYNNLITALGELWLAGAWREDQQYTHTYDANNNLITAVYDMMQNGVWVHSSMDTNVYNNANKRVLDLNKLWDDSLWVNNLNISYTYDDLDYLETSTTETWVNNDWVNSEKHNFSYGEYSGLETDIALVWENENWENSFMKQYVYDENGNALSGNYYTWEGGSWTQNQEAPLEMAYNYTSQTEVYFGYQCDAAYSSIIVGVDNPKNSTFDAVCYPNPFSDIATVRFNLNHYSLVKATLYDASGKEFKQLESKYMNPGTSQIQISSEGLATGVYILKLNVNNYVKALKITIIK